MGSLKLQQSNILTNKSRKLLNFLDTEPRQLSAPTSFFKKSLEKQEKITKMKFYAITALSATLSQATIIGEDLNLKQVISDNGLCKKGYVNYDGTCAPSPRKVPALLGPTYNLFADYGCWCYFGNKVMTGKAQPVDEMDTQCQTLMHAYECAVMDYEEATGKTDCEPWDIVYAAGLSGAKMNENGQITGLVENCNELNPDNMCAAHACMAEGVFILGLIRILADPNIEIDSSNKISNGFDFDANCKVEVAGLSPERECCGLLPYRYPFRPVDRSCCGRKTYDPAIKECCDVDNSKLKFSCEGELD